VQDHYKNMSAISNVSSANNSYPITSQSGFDQIVTDFNSIGSALQSGDVSSALTALSSFQNALQNNPQTSPNQPFGTNGLANTDYQSLVGALQTGNISNAQKAFANLQTDLKAAQTSTATTHKGHHHHGSGGVSAASLINSLATNSTATSASITGASSLTISANGTVTDSAPVSGSANNASGLNVTA
jgi:hypothetical protein